ncbi:hypothetical protein GGR54DRAFT_533049 [Hypoxylon sp. NC1633]|nr:hypothetical protein GGR54DRAFT_533049 [Hypoxylon sp. NC1633]
MYPWSDVACATFGLLCIASALPFVGIPFPTRAWATYYAEKSAWMATRSGLTPKQAGYAGAILRLGVGSACIYPSTRLAALAVNGIVVGYGTVSAYRNGRPMRPQWNMLCAMGFCLVLELL